MNFYQSCLINSQSNKLIIQILKSFFIIINSFLSFEIKSQYWSSFYEKRNVKCYAIYPDLVRPTHYSNDINYVSDTEFTKVIINEEL
jgi:hypothetical protein